MSIFNRKNLAYIKEGGSFGMPYDPTSGGFQDISVSKFEAKVISEKLEILYLTRYLELGPKTTTGREKGELSFTKNWDASLLKHHFQLIEAGIGKVVGMSTKMSDVTARTVAAGLTVLDVTDDYSAEVGYPISFFRNPLTPGNINFIKSATPTQITLEYPISDDDFKLINDGIIAGDVHLTTRPFIQLGRTNGETFQFVVLFDDDEGSGETVAVYKGSGISGSFSFSTKGQAEISFKVKAAGYEDKNYDETAMLATIPDVNINAETSARAIMYRFKLAYFTDAAGVLHQKCPQMFDLKVENTLNEEESQCGLNNVIGYHAIGKVTASAKWRRKTATNLLFARKNENNDDTRIFFSQPDCAYKSYANFTNRNTGKTGVFDSLEYNCDVNSLASVPPIFVPPFEITMI